MINTIGQTQFLNEIFNQYAEINYPNIYRIVSKLSTISSTDEDIECIINVLLTRQLVDINISYFNKLLTRQKKIPIQINAIKKYFLSIFNDNLLQYPTIQDGNTLNTYVNLIVTLLNANDYEYLISSFGKNNRGLELIFWMLFPFNLINLYEKSISIDLEYHCNSL